MTVMDSATSFLTRRTSSVKSIRSKRRQEIGFLLHSRTRIPFSAIVRPEPLESRSTFLPIFGRSASSQSTTMDAPISITLSRAKLCQCDRSSSDGSDRERDDPNGVQLKWPLQAACPGAAAAGEDRMHHSCPRLMIAGLQELEICCRTVRARDVRRPIGAGLSGRPLVAKWETECRVH